MSKIYEHLNSFGFLQKSYHLKFLFVAFLGIHIPLIGIVFFVFNSKTEISNLSVLLIVTAFTLVATIATLLILRNLLKPLLYAKNALEDYLFEQKLPNLPEDYKDEAGILMLLIQRTITSMDKLMQENKEITALLSHNLRAPLGQIKGLAQIMDLKEEENLKYRTEIISVADSQLKSIDDLLQNLSSHVNICVIQDVVDLKDFINQQLKFVSISMKKKNIGVNLVLPEEDALIRTVEKKLALAFQNLLTNAIKFSNPDTAITISLTKEKESFKLSVSDKGIGFSKQFGKNIFKSIKENRREGTLGEHSTGIGLNLSKKTLEQLGAKLEAYSSGENKGAEFTIII